MHPDSQGDHVICLLSLKKAKHAQKIERGFCYSTKQTNKSDSCFCDTSLLNKVITMWWRGIFAIGSLLRSKYAFSLHCHFASKKLMQSVEIHLSGVSVIRQY